MAVLGKLRFGAGTMTIGSAVLTQFSSVTKRRTNGEIDGQTRRLQGGSGRNLLPNWAQGERITP